MFGNASHIIGQMFISKALNIVSNVKVKCYINFLLKLNITFAAMIRSDSCRLRLRVIMNIA